MENTQNADVFVEVSGILKACASTLIKIANDLRLMSSGPDAGFGEINLPVQQAGSSMMPGKVNPVIPEAVIQASIQVMGNDQIIAQAAASGNLELNHLMPLIADKLLESIQLLQPATSIFSSKCIQGLTVNPEKCRQHVHNSTAVITAVVAELGYEKCSQITQRAKATNQTIRELILEEQLLSPDEFDTLISPERVNKLGF